MGAYVKTIPEDELDDLYRYMKYSISTQFGAVPDIEAIEQARRDMPSHRPIKPHVPRLPLPEERSMKIEIGDLMKRVMEKVRK
jgi:hypothetical protein